MLSYIIYFGIAIFLVVFAYTNRKKFDLTFPFVYILVIALSFLKLCLDVKGGLSGWVILWDVFNILLWGGIGIYQLIRIKGEKNSEKDEKND